MTFRNRLAACWSSQGKLTSQAYGLGVLTAGVTLYVLLHNWVPGEPTPPSLERVRFSVAMLSGKKQAAQTAPENTSTTAESATVTQKATDAPAVAASRQSSLPEAVAAAQNAEVGPEIAKDDVPVIPPAKVSMPGGRLMAEDAVLGEDPNPFAVGPRQVFIRIWVDETGHVIKGGIVRAGEEPLRDALILKAMLSRTYATKNLIRIEGGVPTWQLDLVIDYGTDELLP